MKSYLVVLLSAVILSACVSPSSKKEYVWVDENWEVASEETISLAKEKCEYEKNNKAAGALAASGGSNKSIRKSFDLIQAMSACMKKQGLQSKNTDEVEINVKRRSVVEESL